MAPVSCIFLFFIFYFFIFPKKTLFFWRVCECTHAGAGLFSFPSRKWGEIPERRHSGTGSLVGSGEGVSVEFDSYLI